MSSRRRKARTSTLIATAVALACALPAGSAAAAARAPQARSQYDQFIVRFKDHAPEKTNRSLRQRTLDAVASRHGLDVDQVRRLTLGADVIRTHRKLDARAAKLFLARLRADPRVEYVEIDLPMRRAFTPNDTFYASHQWHYHEAIAGINVPGAWDLSTGTGQVVAVLDTGVVAHTDLAANLLPGYDFITNPTTANDGNTRDNDPSDPGDWELANECELGSEKSDSSWHGTHVAGTIAAVTNNAKGVAGVAFGARVVPVRVLGKCGGSVSDIAEAIIWASGGTVTGVPANPHPAKVINLSLGGPGPCGSTTQSAINAAVNNGATVVIAAGNDGVDAAEFSPANCNNIITVAALGRTGARASYSNFGPVVDIAAPGGDGDQRVASTLNSGTTVPSTENYAGYNGTSMAAPHVSGVAALAQAKTGGTLSPAQMKSLLELTSRTLPVPCPLGCGVGLVDAATAVAAAGTTMLTVSDPVSAAEGNSGTHTVTFTVSLTAPATSPVTFDIATANGTATAGSDYVAAASNGQIIGTGQTSKTFVVTVNGDTTPEADETFSATVSNVSGVPVLKPTGTTTIVNDDPIPLANGVPVTGISGATGSQRMYQLDVPSGASNLSIVANGDNGDMDLYVRLGAPPTLTVYDCRSFSSDSTESCPFATPQAGRYYILLDAYASYSGLTLTASYTMGALPTLSVSDAFTVEGDSGDQLLYFTVSLSQVHSAPVSFTASTSDGNAVAAQDYVARTVHGLTIPAGQLSRVFPVAVLGDTTIEPSEFFNLNLSNPSGATIADGQAMGVITNNDGPLLVIPDAAVAEGDGGTKQMVFTVFLTRPAPHPVTYRIYSENLTAQAGSDYTAINLVDQVIPAGQLSRTHAITLHGDTAVEGNEALVVNLRQATGASLWDNQAVGYLLNDDGPTLSVPDAGLGEGNAGTQVMNVVVRLSQAASVPVTYSISTMNASASSGSDYVGINLANQTIPAGQTSQTHAITINGDTAIEANEHFVIVIGNATNATTLDREALGFLYNDDGPTLWINDVTVAEGQSGTRVATFTVGLTQASGVPISYTVTTSNGSATAGSDYVAASSRETIPAGQTSRTFSVTLNGDTAVEANETFRVTLSNPSTGTLIKPVGIGTIANDD